MKSTWENSQGSKSEPLGSRWASWATAGTQLWMNWILVKDRTHLLVLLILIITLAAPLALDGYLVYLANLAIIYAIATTGLTIIIGWSGQFAMCSAAFLGIGTYSGGIAASRWGVPTEVAILFGALVGAILALTFGSLAVRLRRYYMAITAISFMYIMDYLIRNLDDLTGGVRGYAIPTSHFLVLGNQKVSSAYGQYYVSLALLILVYLLIMRLRKSSLGREWQVIRVDERVAKSLGINIYISKLKVFTLGLTVASASGAWMGHVLGNIFPESFTLNEMMFEFLIVALGGLGSVNGAIGASIFLVIIRQYLSSYVGISEILLGVLLLASSLVLQKGIYGTLVDKFKGLREGFI